MLTGWSTWIGDELYSASLHPSKRDLLIGYDLIALRGLPQTEKLLLSKGIAVLKTVVEECRYADRDGFCVKKSGRLVPDSLSWTITHTGGGVWNVSNPRGHAVLSFKSACGFAYSQYESALSPLDVQALGMCWYADLDYSNPAMPERKKETKSHAALVRRCKEIFAAHEIEMVPVKFSKIGREARVA